MMYVTTNWEYIGNNVGGSREKAVKQEASHHGAFPCGSCNKIHQEWWSPLSFCRINSPSSHMQQKTTGASLVNPMLQMKHTWYNLEFCFLSVANQADARILLHHCLCLPDEV